MFYLTAFLTMLISLMIYMMDLTPKRLHNESRGVEGYIVAFVNQHQAAKDYMNYWLGRLNPGRDDGSYKRDCFGGGVLSANVSNTKCENMSGMSFPAQDFLDMLPNALHAGSNYHDGSGYYFDIDAMASSLQFRGGTFDGWYISGLLCVKRTDQSLAEPCFKRQYKTGGSTINDGDFVIEGGVCSDLTDGTKERRTCRTVRNSDAKVYVVTYSKGASFADWWPDEQNRMRRYELWRRALLNRTHRSHGCGILREAPVVGGTTYNWTYDPTMSGRVRHRVKEDKAGDYVYCIDNGQGCVNVLPKQIQTFLEDQVVGPAMGGGAPAGDDRSTHDSTKWTLDSSLFCMTDLTDSSRLYSSPTYHFDGIDKMGLGGPAVIPEANDWDWVSTNDELGPAVICDKSHPGVACGPILGSQARTCFVDDSAGCTNGGMIASGDWEMPFNYDDKDFTFTVIMRATQNSEGWVWGQDPNMDSGGSTRKLFGFKWNGDNAFTFYPAPGIMVVSTNESWLRDLHSWTIRRKSGKVYLYVDNWQLKGEHGEESWPAAHFVGTPEKIKFSANANAFIGDIRYYDRALKNREIRRNYELDAKRYGILRTNVVAGGTQIPDDDN